MPNASTPPTPPAPQPASSLPAIVHEAMPSPLTCLRDHEQTIATVGKVAIGTGAAIGLGLAVFRLFRR